MAKTLHLKQGRRDLPTYTFILHVEEDRSTLAAELAEAIASSDLKVLYESYSVPPAALTGESEVVHFKELVSVGLVECSYGIVLVSRHFVQRPWPESELDVCLSGMFQNLRRLKFVCLDVSRDEIGHCSKIILEESLLGSRTELPTIASAIRQCFVSEERTGAERMLLASLDHRLAAVLGCSECESHPAFELECTNAPPLGASGVLVCPLCGVGHSIREGVPQLLGESGIWPDQPSRPTSKATRRATLIGNSPADDKKS